MKKYVCEVCGYVYDPAVGDPDSGIEPGTAFEDMWYRARNSIRGYPRGLGMPCLRRRQRPVLRRGVNLPRIQKGGLVPPYFY